MARQKKASFYRTAGMDSVSFWKNGKGIRESTGTHLRKLAQEIRQEHGREMILGTVALEDARKPY